MTKPLPPAEPVTVKLRSGATVLAKPHRGLGLRAVTYANVTQAQRKADEIGGSVIGHRPYFVAVEA